MIGTRILKIDLEIAEKFEVKDGTHFTITKRQKIILVLQVATLTSIIFAISKSM